MNVSPLAGKPATPDMLVNVPDLVTAYYTEIPDPSIPEQRVSFGTSGHRGSAFDKAFNEWHILAISQAICLYRKQQKIDGPLVPRHGHPCALRTGAGQRAGSAGRQRRGSHARGRGRIYPDPGHFSRDSHVQPRAQDRSRRWNRDHAFAQSAARRWFQIQPAQRRPGGRHYHRLDRSARPTSFWRTG